MKPLTQSKQKITCAILGIYKIQCPCDIKHKIKTQGNKNFLKNKNMNTHTIITIMQTNTISPYCDI